MRSKHLKGWIAAAWKKEKEEEAAAGEETIEGNRGGGGGLQAIHPFRCLARIPEGPLER